MVATILALFQEQLSTFNVKLDTETIDFITGMLNDMTVDDLFDVRESTEPYLADAIGDKNQLDSFYDSLTEKLKPEAGSSTFEPTLESTLKSPSATTEKAVAPIANPSAERPEKISEEPTEEDTKDSKPKPSLSGLTAKERRQLRQKEKEKRSQTGAEPDGADPEPEIIATSQQSRFARDIVLETSEHGIDLSDVNLQVNKLELLVGADLKLKAGTRYGLVGQNGVGKSMLMKVMADKILIGLPEHISILHIAQLDVLDESVSVLSEVLSADKETGEVMKEYDMLQPALDPTKEGTSAGYQAVYDIAVRRKKKALNDAQKIAIKRSGARGWDARIALNSVEAELASLLACDPREYVTEELSNKITNDILEAYSLVDHEALVAQASIILTTIGFTQDQLNKPISIFSGGWRMRIALAKAQLVEPDILLLDEPTNHLDLPAILWLQNYVKDVYTSDQLSTVVVVSHDREFLSAVTSETIIMKDRKLVYHAGNYDDWEKNAEEQRVRKTRMLEVQDKKKKAIEDSIQQNIQRAKASGDDKRMGMVGSRQKKLERFGMDKTEDGKRFKVSYRAGYHDSSHVEITVDKAVKTAAIKIPDAPPLRYKGPIFQMLSVSFRYPDTKTENNIIDQCSLDIGQRSRIAFLGPNGCGKTTLLNLLVGKLTPISGRVYCHQKLRIGYFSQHIVEDLDQEKTAVQEMLERHPDISEHECRAHFGTVGVSGSIVLRKLKYLSGGQKNRVAFALMLYNSPHVLILDEITNHLDMGTVDMLVDALSHFKGALVLVSHDVWFLKELMEEQVRADAEKQGDAPSDPDDALQSQFYVIHQGQLKRWEKGMEAYVKSVANAVRRGKA